MTTSEAAESRPLSAGIVLALAVLSCGLSWIQGVGDSSPGLACVLWFAPGWLLALLVTKSERVEPWLLISFLGASVSQALLLACAKALSGLPLQAGTFAAVQTAAVVGLGVCVLLRMRARALVALRARDSALRLLGYAALACLVGLFLHYAVQGVDLDDDGAEMAFVSLSLSEFWFPRWPTSTGQVGLGVGMFTQAFPSHFFVTWSGDSVAGVRWPLVTACPIIAAGIVAVSEWKTTRCLGSFRFVLALLSTLPLVLLMTTSTGYGAYWADPASPGGLDLQFLALFVVALWALFEGRVAVMGLAAVLVHFARPTGLLLFALVFVAVVLVGGQYRRAWSLRALGCVLLCVAGTWFHEFVYTPALLPDGVALGYDSRSALARFRYLTFFDWERFVWILLPSGVVPFLAFARWRDFDGVSRTMALVVVAYAAAFYVPAFVCLHHYAPVMILPVVALLRGAANRQIGAGWIGAWSIGLAGALVLSWPAKLGAGNELEELGQRILDLRTVPAESPLNPRDRARILDPLVHLQLPGEDPGEQWVGSAWSLSGYVATDRVAGAHYDWIVQRRSDPTPQGYSVMNERGADVLLVSDALESKTPRPPVPEYAAKLFAIDREVLFRHLGIPAGRYDLDVRDVIPYGDDY